MRWPRERRPPIACKFCTMFMLPARAACSGTLACGGVQIAEARAQIGSGVTNVRFVEASAVETGLPRGSFDLVYCRFLLIHLPEPERALAEMLALLKPNGILVCEDGDLTSAGSEPPSALGAFSKLWGLLGAQRGVDYTLGRRLYQMVLAAGFAAPQI